MRKLMVFDDYNSKVPQECDVIGALTTQFGNLAFRHGWKPIAIMTDPWRHDFEWRNRTTMPVYSDYAPTIRATDYKGPPLVIEQWK